MARRTRSFNELPGHLRVPILRRKDTERTKERLAAGLAGMEELRSLREQQQQLVGETMAKAEDRRHERRQGENGHMDIDASSSQTQSPSKTNQLHQPAHSVARSSFHGYSMDSISEEDDGITNNGYKDPGNIRQNDINNNKDRLVCHSNNNIPLDSISMDESKSYHYTTTPSDGNTNPRHSPAIHHNADQENHCRYLQNRYDTNPTQIRKRNDTCTPHQSHGFVRDTMTQKPVPSFRHSQSRSVESQRQRSMSVDAGHRGIDPSHFSSPSKLGNTCKFSSLTSLNVHHDEHSNFSSNDKLASQPVGYRPRLSQSTSRIDTAGDSRPLHRRRGSLKWDSLLQSIGIQNSTSCTALDKDNEDTNAEINGAEDSDQVFGPECVHKEESRPYIQGYAKKCRSMSFCYGNTTKLLHKHPTQKTDAAVSKAIANGREDQQKIETHTPQTDTTPPKSIHPILRRASIQCEAVLTNSNGRVVNPIQDVDVNSFRSPGPLHAVMLQYQGYSQKPSRGSTSTQKIVDTKTNTNKAKTNTNETSNTKTEIPIKETRSQDKVGQSSLNRTKTQGNTYLLSQSNGTSCQNIKKESIPGSMSGNKQIPERNGAMEHDADLCPSADRKIDANVPTKECIEPTSPENADKRNITPCDFTENEQNKYESVAISIAPSKSPSIKERNGLMVKGDEMKGNDSLGNSHSPSSTLQTPLSTSNRHLKDTDSVSSGYSTRRDKDDSKSSNLINRKRNEEYDSTTSPNLTQLQDNREPIKTVICPGHGQNRKNTDSKSLESQKEIENTNTDMIAKVKPSNAFELNGKDSKHRLRDSVKHREGIKSQSANHPSDKGSQACQRRSEDGQNSCFTIANTFNSSSATMPCKTSVPMLCNLPTQVQINLIGMDERDIDRGKRSSIFSDVSLVSDSSGKTPSSTASIFSDVSMVSDEGYSTWESSSPESKTPFVPGLRSFSNNSSSSLSNTSPTSKLSDNSFNSSVSGVLNRSCYQRDDNGNNVDNYNVKSFKQNGHDNAMISSTHFKHENGRNIEHNSQVHLKSMPDSKKGLGKTSHNVKQRQTFKQTAV